MSRIDLEKRSEQVRVILEKKKVPQLPPIRVGFVDDVSGSAQWMHANGIIQETTSRLMGVSMRLDDNGELDGWAFSTGFSRLAPATPENYTTWVDREIVHNSKVSKWGGTKYSPVMKDIVEYYFGKGGLLGGIFGRKTEQKPTLVLFETDGANDPSDLAATEELFKSTQKYPLYWQMVGVGRKEDFEFIERMADKYPNVGFLHLPNLQMTDDALYNELLSDELCDWLKSTVR